jgi:hypothetical protein
VSEGTQHLVRHIVAEMSRNMETILRDAIRAAGGAQWSMETIAQRCRLSPEHPVLPRTLYIDNVPMLHIFPASTTTTGDRITVRQNYRPLYTERDVVPDGAVNRG